MAADAIATLKIGGNAGEVLTRTMSKQTGGYCDGGSMTLRRRVAANTPAPRSREAVCLVRGLRLSPVTTMSGFPTSPLRTVGLHSYDNDSKN